MEAAWNPGVSTARRVGGGTYLELHTDQGLIGIGPAMDAAALTNAKAQLVGKDPFDIERLAGPLRYYVGGRLPPRFDQYMNLPQGPGLGVAINKAMLG